jgi:triacylglycerol lipase
MKLHPILFAGAAVGLAWLIASALPTDPAPEILSDPSASPGPDGDLPVPVLLVPGWLDTEQDLDWLEERFVEAGWPRERVRAVTFDDPAGSNRAHAVELDVIARSVLRTTGAEALDIVAFSMGGLAARWYLQFGDAVRVRRIVFLATPHHGTMAAHLAWGESRQEMIPGSGFLDSLNAGPALPEGVEAVTIRSQIDTHVIPEENATLPGVADHELCCPTHSGLLEDEDVFSIVRSFLADGTPGAEAGGG